jgi:HSP20 family protein
MPFEKVYGEFVTRTTHQKENAMIVRVESRPMTASPFEGLFTHHPLLPGLKWQEELIEPEITPYVNIADMGDALHVVAEVPGVPKNDIAIQLLGDVLTISGNRKAPELAKNATQVRQEITYGQFERSFKLPYDVDGSKVTAEYQDGVLRVSLPKTEAAKPRAIAIQ